MFVHAVSDRSWRKSSVPSAYSCRARSSPQLFKAHQLPKAKPSPGAFLPQILTCQSVRLFLAEWLHPDGCEALPAVTQRDIRELLLELQQGLKMGMQC